MHARGIEHHSNGVQNTLGTINLVLATGRIGKPNCGYGTITGQANGQGGREHGQKCDQLPGWRDISNPEHRRHIAGIWGIEERDLPGPGVDAYELFRKIDAGEIKGLLSLCFNPMVSLPDNAFVRRCLEKLEFYVAIDFFLNDTAHYADIVLPGSLQEEDEGTVTQVEGRVIKINKAIDCPGEARQDWRIIQDLARALNRPHGFTFASPREIFDELRRASKGGVADYSGITYEKIEAQTGRVLAVLQRGSEDGTTGRACRYAAPVRAGQLQRGRKGERAVLLSRRQGTLQRRGISSAGGRCRRRLSAVPHDRARRQSVSVRHADAPDRSARQAVPRAADRDASTPGRAGSASPTATGRPPRRGAARSRSRRWS